MKQLLAFVALLGLICCKPKKDHEGHSHDIYYTCSMDPQVMETKPGKCPICHMDLTPIRLDQLQENGLKLSEEQVYLANIKTSLVTYDVVDKRVYATGTVKENQNTLTFVNARVGGRIDKLNIKTVGVTVQKGQILYQVYSEMLASTQSEYIQNWKLLSGSPNNPLYKAILASASQKLMFWGLTNTQVEQLKLIDKPRIPYPILSPVSGVVKSIRISEGSTVMEGDPLFELTEYQYLWIDAEFYPNETKEIKLGDKVKVLVQGSAGESMQGKVIQVLPQTTTSSTVILVRVEFVPNEASIRPGMQADVIWQKEGEKSIVIPSNAVLREGRGSSVWIKNKKGVYESKMVHLGKVFGDQAEILHGLKIDDEVVISGAYLLQSEYVFKKGNNTMAGHKM